MPSLRVGLTSVATKRQARELAKRLVRLRLAACVSLLPAVESFYPWKGRLGSAKECLLLVKTTERKLPALKKAVLASHPYDTPEWFVIAPESVETRYLKWMEEYLS